MIFKISSEKIEEFIEKQHAIDGMVSMHDFELWLEEQPRVGEWIPCSERLPMPNEYDETGKFFKAYLVQDKRETMYTALWNGENWLLWTRNIRIENVIAWQPLPEPYKEI